MRCEALTQPNTCGQLADYIIITGSKTTAYRAYFCKAHLSSRLFNYLAKYDSIIVARYWEATH
jgi:hypothetical protein